MTSSKESNNNDRVAAASPSFAVERILLSRLAAIGLGISLAIVAGLRMLGRDRDYLVYQADYPTMLAGHSRYEWLFVKLAQSSAYVFGPQFATFLLLCALIATLTKVLAFRRFAANYAVALVGYVLIYWVVHEMTQIRSGLALGFAALALGFVQERRWPWALATYGIAIGFHNSLIIMAPFFLLPNLWRRAEWRQPLILLLLMAGGMLAIRNVTFTAHLVDRFLGARGFDYGTTLMSPQLAIYSAVTAVAIRNLRDIPEQYRAYVWMGAWGSLLYVASLNDAAYANRLSEMGWFFVLFWVGSLRKWPGRITLFGFLLVAVLTAGTYYRHAYITPFG